MTLEDLVHEKTETMRRGQAGRMHFKCSNPKCPEPIRNDKWDTHVIRATTDLHLQERSQTRKRGTVLLSWRTGREGALSPSCRSPRKLS